MLKVITVPEPILREKSKKVEKISQEILNLVRQMEETATKKEGTKGVGLSAIQVGTPLKIFIAWSEKSRRFLTFINPEIIWRSKRLITGASSSPQLEGCLSVPDVWGLVKRHQVIKIRYQTLTGKTLVRRFRGFAGIICQHEYDHLEGILFTDRVLQQKGKLFEMKKDSQGNERLEEIKV